MIILILGLFWYFSIWFMKVVSGYLLFLIVIFSYILFVFSDMMLFNLLDMFFDREIYVILLGKDEFLRFKVYLIRIYFL